MPMTLNWAKQNPGAAIRKANKYGAKYGNIVGNLVGATSNDMFDYWQNYWKTVAKPNFKGLGGKKNSNPGGNIVVW